VHVDIASIDPADMSALFDHVFSGRTLGPLLGHSAQSLEAMYYFAYTFYRQGKYAEALKIFSLLLICDHLDRRHYMGMAACLQMQRRHADAKKHYRIASMLDMTDPAAFMHIAECDLALGDRDAAIKSLEYALVQAKAHDRHHRWIANVEGTLSLLASARPTPESQPGNDKHG
jgi:type III secretion system low calcium response chaperone LcrH/SycD